MPSKRKADHEDSPPRGSLTVTPIADRRKVKAAMTIGAGTVSSSPGSSLVSASGSNRMRKKQRQTKYYLEMYMLNSAFAEYASRSENRIRSILETKKSVPIEDFMDEVKQYMEKARDIKRKYFPPTGDVLSFGTNEFGQLAQSDDVEERKRPAVIKTLQNKGVVQVACGGLHNLCVSEDGRVDSWGCNDDGPLGNIEHVTAYAPAPVRGFIPSFYEKRNASATSVGTKPKYCWNDLKTSKDGGRFTDPRTLLDPKYEETIEAVAAGDSHSLALSTTGRVYFFGAYKDKEGKAWRDIPPADDPRVHPEGQSKEKKAPRGLCHWPIHCWMMDGEATQISAGFSFNAAVVQRMVNGVMRKDCVTWGLGETGELGRPVRQTMLTHEEIEKIPKEDFAKDSYIKYHVDVVEEDYMVPKPALFADGSEDHIVVKVACGGYHLLVIAKESEEGISRIYSAGLNNYGQTGHPENAKKELENKDRLTLIESFRNVEISDIAAGQHHSICLDSTGTKLYGFGRSCSGQLGHTATAPKPGSFEIEPVPIYLEYDSDGNAIENPVITKIACGGNHCFALTEAGEAYSWGYGDNGALGVGRVEDESDCVCRPKKIDVTLGINNVRARNNERPVKASVKDISGGGQHSAMVASLEEDADIEVTLYDEEAENMIPEEQAPSDDEGGGN